MIQTLTFAKTAWLKLNKMCTIFVFAAEDMDSFTSSEHPSMIQTPDQPASLSTQGMSSLEYAEPETQPPQPVELQALKAEQTKKAMLSSYENVYTGVELEPEKNRMSMDASEIDIGDRFDTKQSESKLHSGLSSSYEKLYERSGDLSDEEGECKSESTSLAVASSVVIDVRSSLASSVLTSHSVTSNSSPVYITVESGLDKLAYNSDSPVGGPSGLYGMWGSHSSRVKVDLGERSASWDTDDFLSEGPTPMTRPVSSPDVSKPVDAGISIDLDKGRACYVAFVRFACVHIASKRIPCCKSWFVSIICGYCSCTSFLSLHIV